MEGYDDASYGDAFADVYDEWYGDIDDVPTVVRRLTELARGGAVLELGVGTGRLAIPLAATGLSVDGIDSSPRMLERLRLNDPGTTVHARQADMVDGLPDGPFDLVFVAYNTVFNLRSQQRQRACFAAVAERLKPGGTFVVEAFVPDVSPSRADRSRSAVTVRSLDAHRVVLSASIDRPDQCTEGQFIEISESGGVRLRPWSLRWSTPAQLDEMAMTAGLQLQGRWASFDGERFDDDSTRHVSLYRAGP